MQGLRDLVRPFLTIWFSLTITALLFAGTLLGKLEWDKAVIIGEGILGHILGYHFGKSSKTDSSSDEGVKKVKE